MGGSALSKAETVSELKVGVVGVGVMGSYHAQVYAGLPGVELVGVADPDPERREEIEQDLEVRSYSRAEELLGKVQAVSIASPTSLHYAQTRMFLEAGVHVLVEKPMTASLPEARELAGLSERQGLVLQVGHIMRFYRAVAELPRLVNQPWVLESRRVGNNRRIRDIGVILDLMIHDLDLVLLLLRERPSRYSVFGRTLDGLDEYAHAVLEFPSGARAVLTASRVSPEPERSFTITQAGEVIRLDFSNGPFTEISVHKTANGLVPAASETSNKVRVERSSLHNDNPLRRQLKHFVDRIVKGDPAAVTLEDDILTLELALELTRSLQLAMVP